MDEIISVIVPCYNVEKYILRCLKSIEEQTIGMEHLEIILVNDASEDNTLAYLKVFEDKHIDNVYIINFKKNKGSSAARNAGLNISTGKYIFFIDADDAIDKTAIEKMYLKAEEYQCDLVECGYRFGYGDAQYIAERNGDDWYKDFSDINTRKWYIAHMPKVTMWGRLWRRAFLKEHNLYLDESYSMSEDVLFTGQAMFLLRDCYYINEQLYFYYINQESLSRSEKYNTNQNRGAVAACNRLIQVLKERGLLEDALSTYRDEFGWYIIGPSYFYTMNNIYKEIQFFRDSVKSIFPDILENKYLQILDGTHAEWMRHFKRG